MLKLMLSLTGSGTLIGSTSAFMLSGEATFRQLRLFAPVGPNNSVSAAPWPGAYDPTIYRASIQMITLPCTALGMEETLTDASPYPACVPVVCTEGCLAEFGYCKANFCFCTAKDHEGINCGLIKGTRDALSVLLPPSWAPSAKTRDLLLASIAKSLNGAAKPQFRSFFLADNTTALSRRGNPAYYFKFSLVDTSGQNLASKELLAHEDSISSALSSLVGSGVKLSSIASPKEVVSASNVASIFVMVVTSSSIIVSLSFGCFLIKYRNIKA
ncbi:hypothetical protein HDU86_008315 [Geranomyces michiganensis]|nr:hypothetical protein HDU86_008315 [Geranomyces michiganensis]